MNSLKIIKKNLVNMPGWRTNKKILVIESDDWGSVSMPSNEVYEELLKKGIPIDKSNFSKYDSLESEEDLNELFHVLTSFKDYKGNHPCITACAVVANPDFEKIRASEFKEYFYEPITETYKKYPNHAKTFEIWKKGMESHLLWPQFHGREHLNPAEWLKALNSGNQQEMLAFENSALLGLTNQLTSKRFMGYLAAFDYESVEELDSFEKVIKEGQSLFENLFAFKSKSFVAPTGIRSDKMDKMLMDNGIEYHQLAQQFLPYNEARYKIRNRFWGATNKESQIYWRRNGSFEPSKSWDYDWVNSVLSEMEAAFRWGKPLVISSHRVNYIGSLVKENREVTLKMLSELISKSLLKYPEIEFMSSDQLGDEIKGNQNFFLGVKPKNLYYDIKYSPK